LKIWWSSGIVIHKNIFATKRVMYERTHTPPRLNNPLDAIILGRDIFSGLDKMMVHIKNQSHVISHSKSNVQTI
jgi:hypothetical protein